MGETILHIIVWSVVTIGLYALVKNLYRRWPRWWLSPLGMTPVLIGLVVIAVQSSYASYIQGTHWLLTLLGPATVAFAIPLYEQRALIRRYWPVLLIGMLVGSATATLSSWALASIVGLNETLRLSLMPRSMSTPFAMIVSQDIGGAPDLTAVFVAITGIGGAVIGDVLLARSSYGSPMARGALFGMAAHGAGTAQAHRFGRTEGAIAGLVMVLVGVMNVLFLPLLFHLLG
ncbi:LrgB family protein [Altericroceibacterium spongiae]|uniref:LrgB family protein n=1 Tax=Altericroceibacterium spongiae TaxID=2320269 RepID=A0A420ES66_9SPHN|nr:LrgB family protein [Altericroceibacterium spongiae]RKF23511.1 LrgB family protein [Altericroceibacterium spongiae]